MNYITNQLKKRVPMIIALMILAGTVALNVAVKVPEKEPDVSYPMANAHVDWQQTFFSGSWGDAE